MEEVVHASARGITEYIRQVFLPLKAYNPATIRHKFQALCRLSYTFISACLRWLCCLSIDEVLAPSSNHQLASDRDLIEVVVTNRAAVLVVVVEHNRDCCFCDTGLPLLVHQFLKAVGTHLQNFRQTLLAKEIPEQVTSRRQVYLHSNNMVHQL